MWEDCALCILTHTRSRGMRKKTSEQRRYWWRSWLPPMNHAKYHNAVCKLDLQPSAKRDHTLHSEDRQTPRADDRRWIMQDLVVWTLAPKEGKQSAGSSRTQQIWLTQFPDTGGFKPLTPIRSPALKHIDNWASTKTPPQLRRCGGYLHTQICFMTRALLTSEKNRGQTKAKQPPTEWNDVWHQRFEDSEVMSGSHPSSGLLRPVWHARTLSLYTSWKGFVWTVESNLLGWPFHKLNTILMHVYTRGWA